MKNAGCDGVKRRKEVFLLRLIVFRVRMRYNKNVGAVARLAPFVAKGHLRIKSGNTI